MDRKYLLREVLAVSTIEATVSMLEAMPEDAKLLVFNYTRSLFSSANNPNPFVPLTEDQILSDLAESRQQIADGKGMNMREALSEMGEKHGFVRSDHISESAVTA